MCTCNTGNNLSITLLLWTVRCNHTCVINEPKLFLKGAGGVWVDKYVTVLLVQIEPVGICEEICAKIRQVRVKYIYC